MKYSLKNHDLKILSSAFVYFHVHHIDQSKVVKKIF